MLKRYWLLLCLVPSLSLASAPTCQTGTFERITNDFQSYVENKLPAPGNLHSVDFSLSEPYWELTERKAADSMPSELKSVYDKYRATYERLDKVYAQNQDDSEIADYYACRQEFYIKEIFNSLYLNLGGWRSSSCDDAIKLDPSLVMSRDDRVALYQELSEFNLHTCKFEAGEADNPADFLPAPDREIDSEAFAPPVLSFDQYRFDLSENQTNLILDTAENEPTGNTQQSETKEDKGFVDYWKEIFSWGSRTDNYDSEAAAVRTSNFLSGREIEEATQIRRAKWENDRNFWLGRAVKSGELLDAYAVRFAEEIFPTLDEANTSLDNSLSSISYICEQQRTEVLCWKKDGTNNHQTIEHKLWSPEQSFN